MLLDHLERRWQTDRLAEALGGGSAGEWWEIRDRFDDWLAGEIKPMTEEEKMRQLLGLS